MEFMNLQSGYQLRKLNIVLISKLREDLTYSVKKLGQSIQRLEVLKDVSSGSANHGVVKSPLPERLARRAWRVWYNKAPHAIGWSKRHYVFHDWRYAFDFRNICDIRYDRFVSVITSHIF